jgi:hypothetical protein
LFVVLYFVIANYKRKAHLFSGIIKNSRNNIIYRERCCVKSKQDPKGYELSTEEMLRQLVEDEMKLFDKSPEGPKKEKLVEERGRSKAKSLPKKKE